MLSQQVDGLLISAYSPEQQRQRDELIRLQPCVYLGSNHGDGCSFVEVDNENGACQAVKYLLRLGHRDICFLGGRQGSSTLAARLRGYYRMRKGSVLALLLLLPAVTAYLLNKFWVNKKSFVTVTGKPTQARKPIDEAHIKYPLFIFCMIVAAGILLFYGTVVFGSFVTTWGYNYTLTLSQYARALAYGLDSLKNSILLGLISALVGGMLGIVIAYITAKRHYYGRGFIEVSSVLMFAVPGTVLGISYVLAFNGKPLALTGTALILIIVFTFRNMRKIVCLLSALLLLILAAGCGASGGTSSASGSSSGGGSTGSTSADAELRLETLNVELPRTADNTAALAAALQEFPAALKTALAQSGVEVDSVHVTVGTSTSATCAALSAGGVDVAFLPSEDFTRYGEGLAGILGDGEGIPGGQVRICAASTERGKALATVAKEGEGLPWDELNGANWGVVKESEGSSVSLTAAASLWLWYEYEGNTVSDLSHARRRLIQQQETGVGGQRPDNFQPPLCAVGERAGLGVCQILHIKQREQLQRPFVGDFFLFPVGGHPEDAAPHGYIQKAAAPQERNRFTVSQYYEFCQLLRIFNSPIISRTASTRDTSTRDTSTKRRLRTAASVNRPIRAIRMDATKMASSSRATRF